MLQDPITLLGTQDRALGVAVTTRPKTVFLTDRDAVPALQMDTQQIHSGLPAGPSEFKGSLSEESSCSAPRASADRRVKQQEGAGQLDTCDQSGPQLEQDTTHQHGAQDAGRLPLFLRLRVLVQPKLFPQRWAVTPWNHSWSQEGWQDQPSPYLSCPSSWNTKDPKGNQSHRSQGLGANYCIKQKVFHFCRCCC